MSEEIMKKLNENSAQIEMIAQKVLEHDHRFDDRDSKFDRVFEKLIEHDERFDRIEDRLDNTATKEDVSKIISTLDAIVGITKDTRQELLFMGERVRRVEEKVEQNTEDIVRIKPLVGLT